LKVAITKRVHFCAGHRLYNPKLSDEKNFELYGPCSNPNGHGHNFVLEVTVSGEPDPGSGMIINLRDLKQIINSSVIDKIDHKNLNLDVDFMKGAIPTTEILVSRIFEILDREIGNGLLDRVTLWESENNRFEISRD
jgi:6-pyruvoyltetrahydropterin/6-carboxytetrahydropterin synthase